MLFLVRRRPGCWVLLRQRAGTGSKCRASSSKGTDLVLKGPTLVTCSPPNPMTRVKMSMYRFGGNTSTESTAAMFFYHLGYLLRMQTPGAHPECVRLSGGKAQESSFNKLLVVPGVRQIWGTPLRARGSQLWPYIGLDSPPTPTLPPPGPSTSRDSGGCFITELSFTSKSMLTSEGPSSKSFDPYT